MPDVKPRSVDLTKLFDPNIKKILSVIGFRRVGKTFTLYDFVKKYGKERCVYINFEDERLPQETKVLTEFVDILRELKGNEPFVLILDEIQNIPEWSTWARRINETTPYRLILSGSSSKLSSREIPTELRGQSLSVQVFPLSFAEFLNFKGLNIQSLPKPDILNAMREYLVFGGMPEIVLAEESIKPLILAEYYNTFVLRDVIERYKLRNAEALRDLLRIMIGTRTYTFSKLSHTLKSLGHAIGKSTVIRYMNWLTSSFFLSNLEILSPKIKNRLQCAKKAYVVDNFFTSRFGGIFSENMGPLMEQAVFGKWDRQRAAGMISEIYYWKGDTQNEVDFAVMKNKAAEELVQVTYTSSMAETAGRETKALVKAAEKLACKNNIVVTWNLEQEIQIKNVPIKFIPIWKYLITESL